MFLVDTNVISEIAKARPHGAVLQWFRDAAAKDIFVAAVTIGEIQTGAEGCRQDHPDKAKSIEDWLSLGVTNWQILVADAAVAREWAKLMHGKPRALAEDGWIAATARVHGLTVATRNFKDFEGFGVRLFDPFVDRRG